MFMRWLGIGLSVSGLAMLLFGIYFLFLGDEVGRWPSTEGEIVDTRIRIWSPVRATFEEQRLKGDITEYYPQVEYRWTVDGTAYEGKRYKLGTTHDKYRDRDQAQAAARRFVAGEPITVYYDPDAPSQAVIDPSKDWFALFVPSVLGLLFVGTGYPFYRWGPAIEKAAAGHRKLERKAGA